MSQTMPATHFWIVWSPQGSTPPRCQHAQEHLAQRAAEEMSKKHPGQLFFVMLAQECYLRPAPGAAVKTQLVSTGDDIPF